MPTNPDLISIDLGTLSLTANRFLTYFIVTHAYIFFSNRSIIPHDTTSMQLECSPTTVHSTIHNFGDILDARLFSAQERSTSELLRTL